jgi:C-terminal processing protease CtpA/Prc
MFATLLTALLVASNVHGYTGVQRSGHTVYRVMRGSPAEKAGLRDKDKIVSVDGGPVHQLDGPCGQNVELDINRDGEILHFTVERLPKEEVYK